MKTLSRTLTVAGMATVLTAFAGATAAQAATTTELPASGTLLGGGAGVSVTVDVDCEAGWTGSVWVEAAQVVDGNRLATGMGYSDSVECTGEVESLEVVILAGADYVPFDEGDAVLRVSASACSTEACEQSVAAGVVPFEDDGGHDDE
ncbi:MAG TPA: hypothetical protein VIG75_03225 [Citricoccus sp.]